MKLRSFFSVLVAVVLLLLSVGAGGCYWLLAQSPLGLLKGGATTSPAAAMFVPRQAPVMVSLLVNPDRLESLRQAIARPEERRQTRAELTQFKKGLLANDLSYDRDVQPWLGDELTWAVTTLDLDRDAATGRQPGYLLAIATKDSDRAREFLQLFWQKRAIAGTDLVFEQYNGVKLIYGSEPKLDEAPPVLQTFQPTPKSSLASAIVGEFVLFANHPKVLRDAIANVQAPDLNLSNADFYTQSLDTLTQSRIGLTFVNLPRLADWLADPAAKTPLESSNPRQTLAIALELKPQGLLADTALVTLTDATAIAPDLAAPVGALQYIPAAIPLSASGKNLAQHWASLKQGVSGYPTVATLLERAIADLQAQWQLDLPADVFSWVTNDYALGLLPVEPVNSVNPQNSNRFNANWIFVADRSQPEAAAGIERLDTIARQQGLTIGPLQLGDRTVSTWTRLVSSRSRATKTLQADVRGVHTAMGQYEIFTSSIAAMEAALNAAQDSLLQGERFQAAIAPFATPNNGYLYLDWESGQSLLERQLPILRVLELAGKPLFEHLRSLTLSSYGSEAGVQRGGLFVRLS